MREVSALGEMVTKCIDKGYQVKIKYVGEKTDVLIHELNIKEVNYEEDSELIEIVCDDNNKIYNIWK